MPRSLPGPVIGFSSTRTSPVVGSSKPAMIRSMVDFPQPEAPIRQKNWPRTMLRSMRPSASTSPSPMMKRLLTARTITRPCLLSGMVLGAPLQQAVADEHDGTVGQEPAHADHDHAGDDEVGARERAPIHH